MKKSIKLITKTSFIFLLIAMLFSTILFTNNSKNAIAEELISTHTITYIWGSEEQEQESKTYKEGDFIVKPNDPFKKGYRFEGWDNEIPVKMGDHDLVFNAQWSEDNVYPTAKIRYITTESGSIIAIIVDPSEELVFGDDNGYYEFFENGSYKFVFSDRAGNKVQMIAYCYDIEESTSTFYAILLIGILVTIVITVLVCSYFFILRPKYQKEEEERKKKEEERIKKEMEEAEQMRLLEQEPVKKKNTRKKPIIDE